MSDLIKFDHERQLSRVRVYFWLMTFLAVVILISYIDSTRQVTDLNHQVARLKFEKDADDLIIGHLNSTIKTYQDRLAAVQDEIQEVEQKKAETARREAAKKSHAEFVHNEVACLADNIYREAAYEPENGQLAVATVTMNRVADPFYPKTVCGVVYERHIKKSSDKIVCMFSWTCKPKVTIHPSIYQRVLAMARAVYFKHERNDDVADATLYHAAYIKYPNWADPDNLVATIGQHLFYKQ